MVVGIDVAASAQRDASVIVVTDLRTSPYTTVLVAELDSLELFAQSPQMTLRPSFPTGLAPIAIPRSEATPEGLVQHLRRLIESIQQRDIQSTTPSSPATAATSLR